MGWTTGYKDDGLAFLPAKRQVVVIPNVPALNPTAAITVAAWLRSNDGSTNRRVLQKGDGDNQYRLAAQSGELVFYVIGPGTGGVAVTMAPLPSLSVWHHVAGTYDGTAIKVYVDGVLVGQAFATGAIAVTSNALHLGHKSASDTVNGDAFDGILDEVLLYDRALGDAEIARLAAGEQPL